MKVRSGMRFIPQYHLYKILKLTQYKYYYIVFKEIYSKYRRWLGGQTLNTLGNEKHGTAGRR